MTVTERQAGYVTHYTYYDRHALGAAHSLCSAINDAKTGLADLKGNLVKNRIRVLFTVDRSNHPKLMKRRQGRRAEQSISSQCI